LLLALTAVACAQPSDVNFDHLRYLTESIVLGGETVDIVHVYANYPDYRWLESADAGTEGVACVDDAARAAVVYLRHFELTHDTESLGRARALLAFVLKMQTADGNFYNFVLQDHTINTTGRTSLKSFGWWASRAGWSLGTGYRVLKTVDSTYAATLGDALNRSLPRVDDLLALYGTSDTLNGFPVPRWLPYKSGSDVTSELLMGLVEWYVANPGPRVHSMIEKLANGLMIMQSGTLVRAPFGLHRSWETRWHMWGNSQTEVLAMAGKVLKNDTYISSARLEADGFYSRLLIDGFLKEWNLASTDPPVLYEQIAYSIRPMAVGLLRLYEATGKRDYLVMAGLAGSWFFGNNTLHQAMYDPSTGRCFDGIRDSTSINKNSGAESTIEALCTLVEIEKYPVARSYLSFKKIMSRTAGGYTSACFRNDRGEEVTLRVRVDNGALSILEGKASSLFQEQNR
jgi:hypothetical protein